MQQSPAQSPSRTNGSKLSLLVKQQKPFAYPEFNMSPITKKSKYREHLFGEHYSTTLKETKAMKD